MKALAAIKAKGVPACRQCGKRPARDCGKLNFDPFNGDYDCDDPEALDDAGGTCDDCVLTFCEPCAKAAKKRRRK